METARFAPSFLTALGLVVCGGCGGSNPVDDVLGESSLTARVGPGGATIRGEGGTPLEGLTLVVPPGALDRVVELSVDLGPDLLEPDTSRASNGLRLRAVPDPGFLAVPAGVTIGVDIPEFRPERDLVVVGRRPADRPSALAQPGDESPLLLAASTGSLDRTTDRFTFETRTFGDLQIRLTDRPRLVDDAAQLVADGSDALAEFTSASVVLADQLLGQAQIADPFDGRSNLLRVLSRLAVAADDRSDTTSAIDSVGELLQRLGIDVARESLLSRLAADRFPDPWLAPVGAPGVGETFDFLRARVRPVLERCLRDLDRVPLDTAITLEIPGVFGVELPAVRQVDTADLLALRGALAGAIFGIDWLSTFDWEFDLASVTASFAAGATWAELLAPYPAFGRLLRRADSNVFEAVRAAVFAIEAGFDALDAETDVQTDDLVTFPDGATPDEIATWREAIVAVRESLDGAGVRRVPLTGNLVAIDVDLSAPLRSGAFEPAFALPEFLDDLPLAGTVDRPDLGGALPGMTQDRATELLCLFGQHVLPELDGAVTIDGLLDDWPVAAEAWIPADPVGDSSGPRIAVDLVQAWVASSGDDLAFRLSVADGEIGGENVASASYRFVVCERLRTGFGEVLTFSVAVDDFGTRLDVTRDGDPVPLFNARVAIIGSDIELAVDRFELFEPDEPLRERVIQVFADGVERGTGATASDSTRGVALRF